MPLESTHKYTERNSNVLPKKQKPKRRKSKSLAYIETGHKKYSLADLNEAIEQEHIKDITATRRKISEQEHGTHFRRMDGPQDGENKHGLSLESFETDRAIESVKIGNSNVAQIGGDEDGDILMEDMADIHDIEMVSSFLNQQRMGTTNYSGGNINEHPRNDNMVLLETNTTSLDPTRLQTVFVIDTNFIISQLQTLESLRLLSEKYHHVIVIPRTAISELDGLKTSTDSKIAKFARAGNNWVYKNLAVTNSGIVGQKLRQKLNPDTTKDDSILDCCLYFKERLGCFVILMSNDKNLCLKALTEEILTVSYQEGMTSDLIAEKSYHENLLRFGHHQDNASHNNHQITVGTFHYDDDEDDVKHSNNPNTASYIDQAKENLNLQQDNMASVSIEEKGRLIHSEIQFVVITTLKTIMKEEYGDDLSYIGFDENTLTSLDACSRCIYDHWVAVFSFYFKKSKIRKYDWKGLPHSLTDVPHEQQRINNMILFWEDIIEILFARRSENDYKEVEEYLSRWNRFRTD